MKKLTKKVYQVGDEPTYSKVDKVYVMNPSDSGGNGVEFDGTIEWDNVTGKPTTFAPSEHTHDARYYTKTEIDEPSFFQSRIDNVTIALAGRELKVKSVDGLTIGVADINQWLAGTSGNIQTQLDGLGESITSLTAGMKYLGKIERYADLEYVGNKENGNLVVVLADESRSGGRSMYVYSDDKGAWEFIGEFTFTDAFLALKDTPTSYSGSEGKVVKVAGERLVFGDVDYADLANKPSSTITEIDGAVRQTHEHTNKGNLDSIGENSNGVLTYKGEEYVRKNDLNSTEKDYLLLGKNGNKSVKQGDPLSFDLFYVGNMEYTDTTFTLKANKVYRVVASILFTDINSIGLGLQDVTNNIRAREFPDAKWFYAPKSGGTSNGNGVFDFIIKPTTTKRFQIIVIGGGPATQYSRNSTLSIHEI